MKYVKPSMDLLEKQLQESDITEEYINKLQNSVQDVFDAFSSDIKIVGCYKSPLNIIINLDYPADTKISKIRSLIPNIELALGSPVILTRVDSSKKLSLSIPHSANELVRLKTVLESKENKDDFHSISAGIDTNGIVRTIDISQQPHMLIGGASGTGKTIFLDDVLINFLYKASPDELKLVLIDPTRTDLFAYNDIPHLLCPVLSNKAEIAEVISLVLDEIRRRNELFRQQDSFIKDLTKYNETAKTKLPSIIVVIDKFSELNYEMPNDFVDNISEISALGRSTGVHLIINVQSPFIEGAFTGTTRANINHRVSFSFSNVFESNAMLNESGAEKLLGSGDMMYQNLQTKENFRAQAAYVSLKEIRRIVEDVTLKNGKCKYEAPYNEIHKDYVILEDKQYMKRILEAVSSRHASVTVKDIQKDLDVSLSEAYEIVSLLVVHKFIDPIANKKHIVNYNYIMDTLNQLDD